jgi:hypothetical protein
MSFEIVDPKKYPGWDDILITTPGYSFFLSSSWAKVLCESYGYTPFYFTAIGNRKFRALVPVMEVNSFLTGKRGVSLPFTDYCEPVIDGSIQFKDLFHVLIDFGKKRGWRYLEVRGGKDLLPDTPPSSTYLGHTLDLREGEEKIFSDLRDSTRRNIKKALAQGVTVRISNDLDAIREFFRLSCLTRKDYGLPPQPFSFFEKVYDHVISKGLGFAALASNGGASIAGAVFFHFGDRGIYKYGASDRRYQELRANNLVMWEGIKWYCQKGCKSLCLGRTEPQNQGLLQFKSGWRPSLDRINYYRYDLQKQTFVPSHSKVSGFHNKIFRTIPIPLLKRVGSLLYRHVG